MHAFWPCTWRITVATVRHHGIMATDAHSVEEVVGNGRERDEEGRGGLGGAAAAAGLGHGLQVNLLLLPGVGRGPVFSRIERQAIACFVPGVDLGLDAGRASLAVLGR
jgi:hypothetical protein